MECQLACSDLRTQAMRPLKVPTQSSFPHRPRDGSTGQLPQSLSGRDYLEGA